MEANQEIIKEFNLFDKKSDVLEKLRKDALNSFTGTGFPTTRNEEWKYTNIKNLVSSPLLFAKQKLSGNVTAEIVKKHRFGGNDALVLVFENGVFNSSLSDTIPADANITISNLALSLHDQTVQKYLGKLAGFENESFVALNTAFADDGLFVHIKSGEPHEQLIHFMHINSSTEAKNVNTLRNLIVADKNTKVSVIESFHSLDNQCKGITNSVTEVMVHANACVELIKAQLESDSNAHINFTQVLQERDSTFDTVTVTLSGAMVRNNLHIKLNDQNCTSHLFGLYILNGKQHVDNHTLVDHAMPNCFSNELYKGILDDSSSGVFNGKVMVRRDAQKTNAYQSNKNILLSDDAQINTKPQLEIYADDVKCTHGATTGQLDEDALFYLRARGIGEKEARKLLNIAFVSDVLNNIKSEEVRNNLQVLAEKKLSI